MEQAPSHVAIRRKQHCSELQSSRLVNRTQCIEHRRKQCPRVAFHRNRPDVRGAGRDALRAGNRLHFEKASRGVDLLASCSIDFRVNSTRVEGDRAQLLECPPKGCNQEGVCDPGASPNHEFIRWPPGAARIRP
jgi:hypothetical protein